MKFVASFKFDPTSAAPPDETSYAEMGRFLDRAGDGVSEPIEVTPTP